MIEPTLIKPTVGSLRDLEFRLGMERGELYELFESRPSLYRPFKKQKKVHPYPGKLRRQAALNPAKPRNIDNPVKQLKDIQKRSRIAGVYVRGRERKNTCPSGKTAS